MRFVPTRVSRPNTAGIMAVVFLGYVGCTINPETGRQQLLLISPIEEVRLGEQATPKFIRDNGGQIPSESVQDYIDRIGQSIAAQTSRPDLPWSFHALDSSDLNAFALPGGKVLITRGLLEELDNEAQLAGVLGHEIGHVTAKHVADRMTHGLLLQLAGVGLGAVANANDEDWLRVLGVGTQLGGTIYLLKFSRDQEIEADRLAVKYLEALAYNPVAQVQVLKILSEASSSPRTPELLSTHPYPKTRLRAMTNLIRRQFPHAEDQSTYHFGSDAYHTHVLDPLEQMPAPRHVSQVFPCASRPNLRLARAPH